MRKQAQVIDKETHFDALIIGSGISGMTAGILMAKEGEKTLILEQHSVAGGLMQTYKRKGKLFPTGVHRIGSLGEYQPLWYYFKYLGILDQLDLVKLSDACSEKVYFPDAEYEIPGGHHRFKSKLTDYFPESAKSIDTYISDLQEMILNIGMYNPSVDPAVDLSMQYTGSLDLYLNKIGVSGRLKSLLTVNNALYGLSSRECPVLTHFIISDSYLNSTYRINEDTTPLAKTLVHSFKTLGGEIRLRAYVEDLIVEGGLVKGVVLDDGGFIYAKKVIYSGHPSRLLDICPTNVFRPVYRKRLVHARNTPGLFGIAFKWRKAHCPLKENDAYIYDDWDVNAQYEEGRRLLGNDMPGMIFLSALPSSSGGNYAVTALVCINETETDLLKKWYQTSREDKYYLAKEKIKTKIILNLKRHFPDIIENIEIIDTYTPVTFSRYTLSKNGTAYGIKKTAQSFLEGMFNPVTRVKNLFMVGQSIAFSGIHGAIVSSVGLCQQLYGKDYLMKKIIC